MSDTAQRIAEIISEHHWNQTLDGECACGQWPYRDDGYMGGYLKRTAVETSHPHHIAQEILGMIENK